MDYGQQTGGQGAGHVRIPVAIMLRPGPLVVINVNRGRLPNECLWFINGSFMSAKRAKKFQDTYRFGVQSQASECLRWVTCPDAADRFPSIIPSSRSNCFLTRMRVCSRTYKTVRTAECV